MQGLLEIINRKGWNLYKLTDSNKDDIGQIVKHGRVNEIQIHSTYIFLPLLSKDDNINELETHFENLFERKKLAKFIGDKEKSFEIDIIYFDEDALFIYPKENSIGQYLKVSKPNIAHALQFAISNYNTYFLDSILDVISTIGSPAQRKVIDHDLRWEIVKKNDSDLNILYPTDANNFFFRGQREKYKNCFPSICRNMNITSYSASELDINSQANFIVSQVKLLIFKEILESLPQFKYFEENKYYLDKDSLAQHYGLNTGFIDVTQSIDVAAFFACSKLNSTNNTWEPVSEGEGIIYIFDETTSMLPYGRLKAIGLQPFPRPAEQWAWTCELNMSLDFDKLPNVERFIFRHNCQASKSVLSKVNDGKDLFPVDKLADITELISNSNQLPINLINETIDYFSDVEFGIKISDKEFIMKEISKMYALTDNINCIDLDLDKLILDSNAEFVKILPTFERSIRFGFRPVRTKKE